MFGPEERSAAADTQPLSAAAAAAAPKNGTAAAPALAQAAMTKKMNQLAPASSLAASRTEALSALPHAAMQATSEPGSSGTYSPATWLQALAAAQSARPAEGGAPINLQSTPLQATSPSTAWSPQTETIFQQTADVDTQAADVDMQIASNWAAIANNWDLLGGAASSGPPHRRALLGDVVSLTSAQTTSAVLTQRPAGRLERLLDRARGTISGIFTRRTGLIAAGGHHSSAERPTRRSLLAAFPPGVALLSFSGRYGFRSP